MLKVPCLSNGLALFQFSLVYIFSENLADTQDRFLNLSNLVILTGSDLYDDILESYH